MTVKKIDENIHLDELNPTKIQIDIPVLNHSIDQQNVTKNSPEKNPSSFNSDETYQNTIDKEFSVDGQATKEKDVFYGINHNSTEFREFNLSKKKSRSLDGKEKALNRGNHIVQVTIENEGSLYLDLLPLLVNAEKPTGAYVSSFRRASDGSMGETEASGKVSQGDVLVGINGEDMTDKTLEYICRVAKNSGFPKTLSFRKATIKTAKMRSHINSSKKKPLIQRRKSFDKTLQSAEVLQSKLKNWSGNLNAHFDKNKQVDGMKNLWRRTMGKKAVEEIDYNEVSSIINHISLQQQGYFHTSPLILLRGNDRLQDQDIFKDLVIAWYRMTKTGSFIHLRGVSGTTYCPSIDDVGTKICVQCQSAKRDDIFKITESNPIRLDPKIKETVSSIIESGFSIFSATLASCENESFQLAITNESVQLKKVSENEENCGIVIESIYHSSLLIFLDPGDGIHFKLSFKEGGYTLGEKNGEICDLKQDLSQYTSFLLCSQTSEIRDVIALLIRSFREQKITKSEELEAESKEIGWKPEIPIEKRFQDDETDNKKMDEKKITQEKREDEDEENDNEDEDEVKDKEESSPATFSGNEVFLARIVELQNEVSSLTLSLKAGKNDRALLTTAVEVRDHRLQELKDRLHCVETERNELIEKNKESHQNKKVGTKINEENDRLKQAIQSLEKDKESIQMKLNESLEKQKESIEHLVLVQEELKNAQSEIIALKEEKVKSITERNVLVTKASGLSKELRRLMTGGKTMEDLIREIQQKNHLKVELAEAQAVRDQMEDEMMDYKTCVHYMERANYLKDKEILSILSQNEELKLLVSKLTDALSDKTIELETQLAMNRKLLEGLLIPTEKE